MDTNALIITLVIGAIAGWLAGQIRQGYGFGTIGNIAIGILGGFLGSFFVGRLGVSFGGGLLGSILTSTAGALVLLFLIGLFRRA